MGGGGFLYHMQKSLEGNRALLKKGGYFNNANDHEVTPKKTMFTFKSATKQQLLFYRSLALKERKRVLRKILIISAVLFVLLALVLLLFLMDLFSADY